MLQAQLLMQFWPKDLISFLLSLLSFQKNFPCLAYSMERPVDAVTKREGDQTRGVGDSSQSGEIGKTQ